MKPTIPVGTLVLWKGKYLRTVISSSPGYVTLPIRHRSWTNRAKTTYMVNELLNMGCKFLKKKTKGPCLKSEVAALLASKFKIRQELRREIKEAKALAKRMGRPVCSGVPRLIRLTR